MEKIRKVFFEWNMTWPKVIIGAIVLGVLTGLLMIPEKLQETSFQDIGISLECWILFALIIILNQDKATSAMAKCFVFFLISQPLVYLVQVPFVEMGFGIFGYYRRWFIMTLLTIPGSFIAYQVKRKDWLSVLILSVATGLLAFIGGQYAVNVIYDFPHHLLSAIFCFATAVIYCFAFLDEKKTRIAALAITLAALAVSCVMNVQNGQETITLPEGTWTYEIEDDEICTVKMKDESSARFRPDENGATEVVFTNEEGESLNYFVSVTNGRIFVQPY